MIGTQNQWSFTVAPTILTLIECDWNYDHYEELDNYDPSHPTDRDAIKLRHFAVSEVGYSYQGNFYAGGASLNEPTDMNQANAVGKLQIAFLSQSIEPPNSIRGLLRPSRHFITIKQLDLTTGLILRTLKTVCYKTTSLIKDELCILECELSLATSLTKDAIITHYNFDTSEGMHQ
jgi:hypothetical protein